MWSLGINYYKHYHKNESKSDYDIGYLMRIYHAYSENLLNSSSNDNINHTSCLADNQINDSFACSMFWNETTSVFDENIENSSTGNVEDNVTLNLGLAVPMGIVMYLLSLVTVVGNAMVLHAIRTERRLQTVSTNNTVLLLASLCIPPSVPALNIFSSK
jgi:hypothetical protein